MPSRDRIKAGEEHRREQERHKEGLARAERNKDAIREHGQQLQDKYAAQAAANKQKSASVDRFAKGKRSGELPVSVTGIDRSPKKSVKLPPAVGNAKAEKAKQSRAEKKAAARERKDAQQRAAQIDAHRNALHKKGIPANVPGLEPAEQPLEIAPAEQDGLSDADRLEQAAANRDQVAPAAGPDASDPVLQAAEALGDIGELREAIDGPPTGLDWDSSVPQEVRDAKEQEYISRGLAKPGERILDDPLPISTAEMRRNAIARKRQYEKIYETLRESIPPKVEDEEEYDALLVSHGEAVEAYDNLHSRFTSANLSKLQSGKISRSLVAQDMEKIIAAGVPDNLQKAKLLGYVAELKAIE